jgi:uncharacterized membrane protein YfcA
MLEAYEGWQIAVVLGVYLFAATAKGVTGLGFSTTCLPFLVLILGLKETLPLLIIPSLVTNIVVMAGAGRFRETCVRFWPMFLATIPGLLLGLWLLGQVNGRLAGAVLGLVLIAYCMFAFAKPEFRLPKGLERPLAPLSGVLTGVFNGLTGSQVMPILPYMIGLRLDRNVFLQATNISFTLSSLIMAVGLLKLGLMHWDALVLSTIGVLCATAGVRLGERIRHRLSPEQFRLMVLILLVAAGLSLIVRGF